MPNFMSAVQVRLLALSRFPESCPGSRHDQGCNLPRPFFHNTTLVTHTSSTSTRTCMLPFSAASRDRPHRLASSRTEHLRACACIQIVPQSFNADSPNLSSGSRELANKTRHRAAKARRGTVHVGQPACHRVPSIRLQYHDFWIE